MGRLVYDVPRVSAWMDEKLGQPPGTVQTAIGYERGGELVAGVAFDNLTDNNIFAHIVSKSPLLPAALLIAVGRYVFKQLGLDRMTFMVAESNDRCVGLIKKLGAKFEGRLARATKAGDMLIFALWHDCEFGQRLHQAGRY